MAKVQCALEKQVHELQHHQAAQLHHFSFHLFQGRTPRAVCPRPCPGGFQKSLRKIPQPVCEIVMAFKRSNFGSNLFIIKESLNTYSASPPCTRTSLCCSPSYTYNFPSPYIVMDICLLILCLYPLDIHEDKKGKGTGFCPTATALLPARAVWSSCRWDQPQ